MGFETLSRPRQGEISINSTEWFGHRHISGPVPNSYMQFIVSIEQKGLGLRDGGVSSEAR